MSDPIKRAIYDTYGEEGLNAKWEVGPRYKTSEEVRVKDDDEMWMVYTLKNRSEPSMKRRSDCNENKNWRTWYDPVVNSSSISMRLAYSILMNHQSLLGLDNHLLLPKEEDPCMHYPKHRFSNCLCDIHSRYITRIRLDQSSLVDIFI